MLLVVILVGGIAAGPASAREPSVAERLDTLPALPRQAILRFARTDLLRLFDPGSQDLDTVLPLAETPF